MKKSIASTVVGVAFAASISGAAYALPGLGFSEPAAIPLRATVIAPEGAFREGLTSLLVKVEMPESGCFTPVVSVTNDGPFVHKVTPKLFESITGCASQAKGFAFTTISLGELPAGEHTVVIKNTLLPSSSTSIEVAAR